MSAATQVTLWPVLPASFASLRLDLIGDDQLSGGVGMWSTLNRPRRRDAVQFDGVSGFTYVLPLLLDGMEAATGRDVSVESGCQTLLDWASSVQKATKQPVVLKAAGPLKTPDTVRWVIGNLEWGAQVRNASGSRVQQFVTVTLTQFSSASVRTSTAKKSRAGKGK